MAVDRSIDQATRNLLEDAILKLWSTPDELLNRTRLVVVYTSDEPLYANAMPRKASAVENVSLDLSNSASLTDAVYSAIRQDDAIHDGAIMIKVDDNSDKATITGWSYRLYPPEAEVYLEDWPDHGSAFHSALHQSCVEGVRCVYYLGGTDLFRVQGGRLYQMESRLS